MLVLDQKVTVWKKAGNLGKGETFTTGVVVDGRWSDREGITKDNRGSEITTSHRVYVDTDVSEGDYVYLGEYGGDLSVRPDNAYEVVVRRANPLTSLIYLEL